MNTPDLLALRNRAFLVGAAGLVASVVGLLVDSQQFFRSYLVGYLYWAALPLGCLALLMLHHLVGGGWGVVIRRLLEAGTRTFPLLGLLAIPILIGAPKIYIWAQPDVVAKDPLLQHKALFLNVPGFIVRGLFYLAVWMVLSYFLNKYSAEQEREQTNGWKRKLQNLSAVGLLLYGLTVTFASIDWVMSIDPHWYSTIYGMMFMVGGVLTAMAFIILMLSWMREAEPMESLLRPSHFHDLGSLMFAFLMLWAYISFSQFLIIWSGNLPEEIIWYVQRFQGTWGAAALSLVVFHFAIPFFFLLIRRNKRKAELLWKVAVWMLIMRLVDMLWVVTPSFHVENLGMSWMDFAVVVGLGGIWVGFFAWQLQQRPLAPVEAHLLAVGAEGSGGH